MAALSWGTEAEMFGSLMMLASGFLASSPSSARSLAMRCSGLSSSGNRARMRPDSEMSRVSTSMPAERVNACTMGSNEYVASIGASSVSV
jgi:hypothetical protein